MMLPVCCIAIYGVIWRVCKMHDHERLLLLSGFWLREVVRLLRVDTRDAFGLQIEFIDAFVNTSFHKQAKELVT
jgi:hypothetical protein